MGSDNAGKSLTARDRRPRRRCSCACCLPASLLVLLLIGADSLLYGLSVWLMLFDGVRGQLTFATAGKFSRCQSAMPLASWVRTRLESRLLATEPRPADPVPELAADVDCSETLAGAGWHAPWILRGAKERTNMSADWILRHHSKRLETVMAVDMAAWAERWAEIDDCPVARKKLHAERPLAEVLSQNSSLYAAFDEGFLDANQKTFGELRSQMLSLRDLCGFQGCPKCGCRACCAASGEREPMGVFSRLVGNFLI